MSVRQYIVDDDADDALLRQLHRGDTRVWIDNDSIVPRPATLHAISRASSLRSFSLDDMNIDYVRAALIVSALCASRASLERLYLSRNPITDQGLTVLLDALISLRIDDLDLTRTNLTAASSDALVDLVARSNLKFLILSRNKLGSEAATAIVNSALTTSTIRRLELQCTYLTESFLESVPRVNRDTSFEIDVRFNRFTPDAADTVAKLLRIMPPRVNYVFSSYLSTHPRVVSAAQMRQSTELQCLSAFLGAEHIPPSKSRVGHFLRNCGDRAVTTRIRDFLAVEPELRGVDVTHNDYISALHAIQRIEDYTDSRLPSLLTVIYNNTAPQHLSGHMVFQLLELRSSGVLPKLVDILTIIDDEGLYHMLLHIVTIAINEHNPSEYFYKFQDIPDRLLERLVATIKPDTHMSAVVYAADFIQCLSPSKAHRLVEIGAATALANSMYNVRYGPSTALVRLVIDYVDLPSNIITDILAAPVFNRGDDMPFTSNEREVLGGIASKGPIYARIIFDHLWKNDGARLQMHYAAYVLMTSTDTLLPSLIVYGTQHDRVRLMQVCSLQHLAFQHANYDLRPLYARAIAVLSRDKHLFSEDVARRINHYAIELTTTALDFSCRWRTSALAELRVMYVHVSRLTLSTCIDSMREKWDLLINVDPPVRDVRETFEYATALLRQHTQT